MKQERKTIQQHAIRAALEAANRPLSPREVHALAQRAGSPGLGLATVYRVLKSMIEAQAVTAVDLPGEPARYEISGKAHHHHFHCRGCGKVFEVEGCPGDLKGLVPRGFRLEGHEVILYGRCSACIKS